MRDEIFEKAVETEIDRLARSSPCDLMQLESHEKQVDVEDYKVDVTVLIQDFGDRREIGVLATKRLVLGACKKFSRGLSLQLKARRLANDEAASLYD